MTTARLALLVAGLGIASTLPAATLEDCYRQALKRSETLAEDRESIYQAEQLYHQAIGAVLPNLALNFTYFRQDDHWDNPMVAPQVYGQNPPSQNQWTVQLSQPLFRGFSEYAAIREMKDSLVAGDEAHQWAGMQLYQDVSSAFFNVLALEKSRQLVDDEIKLYDGRLKELNDFLAIGRSRPSDVETVQADQALLQATEVQLEAQIAAEREVLGFLTGEDPDQKLETPVSVPASAGDLSAYLKDAEDRRPDLKAAKERLEAAKENLAVNQGAHLPQVGLLAHWYVDRPGSDAQINWDAAVSATLPLFEGFSLVAKDRQAKSQVRQAELDLERQRRQNQTDIRTYWRNLDGDLAQVLALDKGARLADKAYLSLKSDYEKGLCTNQDVLLALTSSRDAQRALENAKFAARNDSEQLAVAAGLRLDRFQEDSAR